MFSCVDIKRRTAETVDITKHILGNSYFFTFFFRYLKITEFHSPLYADICFDEKTNVIIA